MKPSRNLPLRDLFFYHRRAWSPRAAYHLARLKHGWWSERLVSLIWLADRRIPFDGAAPSMNHRGI